MKKSRKIAMVLFLNGKSASVAKLLQSYPHRHFCTEVATAGVL